MEYLSSATSIVSAALSYVDPQAVTKAFGINQPTQIMYLDPIITIFELAMCNFHHEGWKLYFSNNRMYVSQNTVYQGAQRTVLNATGMGEANWVDLYNLGPALYHALVRLDPINNAGSRLICILAWRALESLYHTYENPDERKLGGSRNPHASSYIRQVLQRMIIDCFNGKELRPYLLNINTSQHCFKLSVSKAHWMRGGTDFLDIHALILRALDKKISGLEHAHVCDDLNNANNKLNEIATLLDQSIEKSKNYGGDHGQLCDYYFPIDISTFLRQVRKLQLENKLRKNFWFWFEKIDQSKPKENLFDHTTGTPWKEIGIPVTSPDNILQPDFFEWLGFPSDTQNRSDIDLGREYSLEEAQNIVQNHTYGPIVCIPTLNGSFRIAPAPYHLNPDQGPRTPYRSNHSESSSSPSGSNQD